MRALGGSKPFRGAFSLIELIVVIVIIGAIYAIAASAISANASARKASSWSLERLDTALRELNGGYSLLYCEGERCQNCRAVSESGETIAENLPIFEETPKVRYFDSTGYLAERAFFGDRCFEMEKYENGSVSELLIEHRGKFYRYYPLIRRAEIYENAVEAANSIDARRFIPETSVNFYGEGD